MTESAQLEMQSDASQYEYLLPDHWIRKEFSYWQDMHDSYVNYVVTRLKELRLNHIVEVGCGDGWNCGRAVEAGLDVVGFDWSRNGIEHAKRMVPRATFFCADIRDPQVLAEYRGSFEGAMFIEVLEHIPPQDCGDALRSIRELLQENGVLLLTTPSTNVPADNVQHYRHFTPDLLKDVVEAGGFKVQDIVGYGDIRARRSFYRWARFVNNRLWLIKPAHRWLLNRFSPSEAGTDTRWSEGLILTATKV